MSAISLGRSALADVVVWRSIDGWLSSIRLKKRQEPVRIGDERREVFDSDLKRMQSRNVFGASGTDSAEDAGTGIRQKSSHGTDVRPCNQNIIDDHILAVTIERVPGPQAQRAIEFLRISGPVLRVRSLHGSCPTQGIADCHVS